MRGITYFFGNKLVLMGGGEHVCSGCFQISKE